MSDFDAFFRLATGQHPYDYQRRVAHEGLPDVLQAPTGAGKTAAIAVAWLWRRHRHPDSSVRNATPRRLVLALPMRVLVDQVAGVIGEWLDASGLATAVDVHVLMGGQLGSQHAWRTDMHRSSIVVGTSDIVVSKLLVRAYGSSRSTYPMDFALLTNGAHVVLDEVQLAPEATATLRQLSAFVRSFGAAEPFGVTVMSATVDDRLLDTVDRPWPGGDSLITIGDADRSSDLADRLAATRSIRRAETAPGDARDLARQVLAEHRPGTRTLVVLNTVRMAVDVARALDRARPEAEVVLVHSRFRAVDRSRLTERVVTPVDPDGPGTIVVATQVVEAGVDLDSRTLVIEAAPWPSVVQRAGRCNRYAQFDDAQILWAPPRSAAPYAQEDVDGAVEALTSMEGATVSAEDLLQTDVATADPEVQVLRRADFLGLFDTGPDLTGADVDVAPFIRVSQDLDVHLAWLDVDPAVGPPADTPLPDPAARCPVPVGALRELKATLWRLDAVTGRWQPTTRGTRPRPGEVLVLAAREGGYDPRYGFLPNASSPVDPIVGPGQDSDPQAVSVEGMATEVGTLGQAAWLSLTDHLDDTLAQARALVTELDPDLDEDVVEAVAAAAYLHDVGKAATAWQEALLRSASDAAEEAPSLGVSPWAKSPTPGRRLLVEDRPGFRHELVSALLLAGREDLPEPPLVRYLVAAHHGRIRVQVHDPTAYRGGQLLGVRHGENLQLEPIRVLDGVGAELRVDLAEFSFGGSQSWTRTALKLRDDLGPVRLAYLETLVRVADWRASAGLPLPGGDPQ